MKAAALIEKLPLSWKDYKMILMHETKDFSMQELEAHIHIEEQKRSIFRHDILFCQMGNLDVENLSGTLLCVRFFLEY